MASVAKTKWKFFNTISYKVDYENTYNINFKTNNFDCTQLTFIKINTGSVRIIYKFNGGTIIAYDSMREPVWANDAYKTITIYDGQDVETAVLEVFLNANAEKLDFPNYAIYDRNNVVKLAEAFRNKLGTTELLNHTKMINLVNNLALQKQEVEKTYTLDFSSGNIVDTPTSGQVFSKVTIVKPSTLIPSNILAPVTIAGVQGSIETYATPESLGKVYKFNTSPTIPTTAQTYIYNFKSNGEHYTYLAMGNNIITYANSGGEEIVYNNGWTNDEYRTVCFEEIPQGELLTMLNNNAIRQNSELYFTTNGETTLATQEKYLDGNLKVIVDVKQLDTSDATATANDIRYTKSAYVNGVKVEGSIQGYANETANLFSITGNLTNVSATIPEYIEEGETLMFTITANSGYALPDSINVSGCTYTYNKDSGEISLSGASSDVVINVVGVEEVTEDALAWTWVFNDNAYGAYAADNKTFNVTFISNAQTFNSIIFNNNPMNGGMFYDTLRVVHPDDTSHFIDQSYRTIAITSKFSEVTNGDELLAWLQANATKQ